MSSRWWGAHPSMIADYIALFSRDNSRNQWKLMCSNSMSCQVPSIEHHVHFHVPAWSQAITNGTHTLWTHASTHQRLCVPAHTYTHTYHDEHTHTHTHKYKHARMHTRARARAHTHTHRWSTAQDLQTQLNTSETWSTAIPNFVVDRFCLHLASNLISSFLIHRQHVFGENHSDLIQAF